MHSVVKRVIIHYIIYLQITYCRAVWKESRAELTFGSKSRINAVQLRSPTRYWNQVKLLFLSLLAERWAVRVYLAKRDCCKTKGGPPTHSYRYYPPRRKAVDKVFKLENTKTLNRLGRIARVGSLTFTSVYRSSQHALFINGITIKINVGWN